MQSRYNLIIVDVVGIIAFFVWDVQRAAIAAQYPLEGPGATEGRVRPGVSLAACFTDPDGDACNQTYEIRGCPHIT